MKKYLRKFYFILDSKNLYKLTIVLFLTFINTLFELITIGLIIPILGIFVGEGYEKYTDFLPILKTLTENEILIYIFIIFAVIYFLKFLVSIYSLYLRNKFCWGIFKNLSRKIFYHYIHEDYLSHLSTHSSEKLNIIRNESNLFSFGVVWQVIDFIIDIILIVSICIFLLYYNFKLSFFVIIFFIFFSLLWNKYYNQYLKKIGEKREFHSKGSIEEIQNSFGNFRETIIFGLIKLFLNRFDFHNEGFSLVGVKRDTITQIPRYLLEFLSVIGVVAILLVLIKINFSLSEILVFIGVFIFAILRMLPSVVKIIRSIQTIKFNKIVVEKIYNQLFKYKDKKLISNYKLEKSLNFEKLALKNLNFKYDDSTNLVLKNINLEVCKGEKIGIVGETGSGKSTLINIILGLININNENLKINHDVLKDDKILLWQSNIGYVSHDVFLLDENLGYNISLNENYMLEKQKIIELLKKVELYEFVEKQPYKINTIVGEKGGKLSRGQIQRIGIARALYKDPSVLIFDEATSALDNYTERKILEKLYKNNENLTIISVSHRKSALEFCDKIFEINNSELKKI